MFQIIKSYNVKLKKVLSKLPQEDQEQLSFLLKKLRNAMLELQKIRYV